MEFNIFLLLGLCAIICTQFNFSIAKALVGPSVRLARLNEFPFVVSIAKRSATIRANVNDHLCTATLISRSHSITAANCFYARQHNDTVVLFGSNALVFTRVYDIEWWILYNEWSYLKHRQPEFLENDIAVVKTTELIQANFQPAVMSTLLTNELVNQDVMLAGWGITRRGIVSPNLQTSLTTVISNIQCEDRIYQLNRRRVGITESLFCTYGIPYTLIQNGDIGGPVLHMNRIIGIHKQVLPYTGSEFHPSKVCVHSSINYYRGFITEVISDNFAWM